MKLSKCLLMSGMALLFVFGLSACGGGGGGNASTNTSPVASAVQMGGAIQTGKTLALAAPQASNTTTTLAGVPVLFQPYDMVSDGAGDLYIVDTGNNVIRKYVIATGQLSIVAGGYGMYSSTDGTGSAARFNSPSGITTDGNALFVTDTFNDTIREIAPSSGTLAAMTSANAVVTTLAGTATATGSTDATGSAARFNYPYGIATDGNVLYVADYGNNTIREIAPSSGTLDAMTSQNAVVTTLAGSSTASGSADGTGTTARFNNPEGIATDGNMLFVTDTINDTIREIAPSSGTLDAMTSANAVVTTLAGLAGTYGSADGTGTAALFNQPAYIATDGNTLFVTDSDNYTVRKIAPSSGTLDAMTSANAVVTTLAGTAGTIGSADGTGLAATFSYPQGITVSGNTLYIADADNNTLRAITPSSGTLDAMTSSTAQVTTPVGGPEHDGTGTAATFDGNSEATTDGINLYIIDCGRYGNTVRKLNLATGQVTTLAGSATARGTHDGTGTAAQFSCPGGITTDGTALYVADQENNTIRKIAPSSGSLSNMTSANAVVTTLAGTAGTIGSADGTGLAATFNFPWGITTDDNALFVVDTDNHTVRKIAPSSGTLDAMTSANAVVTTLAGTAGTSGSTDGTGSTALFNRPADITTDGKALFITDSNNNTIRKIAPSSGTLDAMTSANAVVTTLAGLAGTSGSSDGVGSAALFYYPFGITTDGSHLYVTDQTNNTLRMITPLSGSLDAMTSGNANVTTLTGNPGKMGVTDGSNTTALFDCPYGITTDGTALYVQDDSELVRKIQ